MQYEVEVYETVTNLVLYTVEANSETEALEKADMGETGSECQLQLMEVKDRQVITDTLRKIDNPDETITGTPGEHCPDEACPGVIEDNGTCSHCGEDFTELEHQ